MIYDNIRSLWFNFAINYIKKNKKTSLDLVIKDAESELIDWDIEEYNSKKKNAEKEILDLYKEIDWINNDFKVELKKIQGIYIGDAKDQIDFIRKEKNNYQSIVSSSSSVFENMEHFQEMIKDYLQKIQIFSSGLNKLSSQINTEISDSVKSFKSYMRDFTSEEKSKLTIQLRDYYETKKEDLNVYFEKQKKTNIGFSEHDLALHEDMKKTWLYTKFHILFFLCLIIALIDYWIIFIDVREFNNISEFTSTGIDLLMANFVFPLLFSFWVILVEFLNIKVIKKHSKWWSNLFHTMIFIMIFAVVIIPMIGIDFSDKDQFVKFWARLLIFFMLIPLLVFLMDKYITWDYLKMYVHYVFRWIGELFSKLFSPITWLIHIIKSIFLPIERRITINLSGIWIKYQWTAIHELEEKLHIAKILYKNIDSINDKIYAIKNYSQSIVKQFLGWNKVFDTRIQLLQKSILIISNQLNSEIKQLEIQSYNQKKAIEESIHSISTELGKDEDRLKRARMDLKNWIMEAFNQQD